ncbi:MAG: bifunctional precorrin-2 dehydrogenase/sirohydrochlorin ferrochelatase, partial [Armatimonadota bacterium]|nr:bifunctional precorrin-2 dehydrogenase/sirohydrochlorin ferrochelatase [Armatimonadota bacterium]
DAQERNLLVCCADGFADGNFTTPAQVTRGDLTLTVSTNGSSPTLAAVLRERLEDQFGPNWIAFTALLGRLRPRLQTLANETARRTAVRRLLDDAQIWDAFAHGADPQTRAEILLAQTDDGTDD